MAALTIRNLDDEVKDLLRLAAARNGHSMEEEARIILRQALQGSQPSYGLGSRLQQRFSQSGGVELTLLSVATHLQKEKLSHDRARYVGYHGNFAAKTA